MTLLLYRDALVGERAIKLQRISMTIYDDRSRTLETPTNFGRWVLNRWVPTVEGLVPVGKVITFTLLIPSLYW